MARRFFSMTAASMGAAAVIAPIGALAQAEGPAVALDPIVLSGGLTPIPQEAFGRASTVLTEADIAAQGERYIADVLRSIPGLAVSRTGAFGGLTQVRIRGHEGNHTLVLIDGVEVNTVNQGEYDFGGLLTADIDRIEVLRGPQSSIYGSNAIGGVISITTRRATAPGLSGAAGVELGTSNTVNGQLALRQGFENGGLSFSATRQVSDGFDVSGADGEDDGDRNTTLNLTGDYALAPGVVLGGTLRATSRVSDFDGFTFGAATTKDLVVDAPGDYGEVDELFASLFLEAEAFGGRLDNRLAFTFADTDRVSFTNNAKSGDNSGIRRTLAYSGTVALDASTVATAAQTLTFAVQYEDER
ncbi:MAG: TonB-dependent receptor plug domain-containing protein, partial [Pseudomonadota bacterium]